MPLGSVVTAPIAVRVRTGFWRMRPPYKPRVVRSPSMKFLLSIATVPKPTDHGASDFLWTAGVPPAAASRSFRSAEMRHRRGRDAGNKFPDYCTLSLRDGPE